MQCVVAKKFDDVCGLAGAQPAVVENGAVLSYDDLKRWSERISLELDRNHGMDGRRVAVVLSNSGAFVAAFFAVARLGGIVAPLNVGYRRKEIEHYLSDMDVHAVIVSSEAKEHIQEAMRHVPRKPAILLVDSPGSCNVLTYAECRVPSQGYQSNESPPLLLLYTSGSTGPPKRVVRRHAHILAEIETLHGVFDVGPQDRFIGAAPFSHVNGLIRSMLTAMLAGATLYPLGKFARRPVLELISKARVTFFGGVPQMFSLLAQTPRRGDFDLSSLRVTFSSSAPLTAKDNREFHRVYGFFVRQLYGSSETGTISYNDHSQLGEHIESVGRALPGVSIAVLDERGDRLPHGVEGEIGVSSPFAISSYEGNVAATQRSFRNGFYLTGDLGRVDPSGYVTLTGRKSLMINRGGYKVNPHEVEEVIRQHPRVSDVAVLGAPGPHGDQAVCSHVVVSGDCSAEEIILHCRDHIADYKIPSRVIFRKSLPKTATGKVRRDLLQPSGPSD